MNHLPYRELRSSLITLDRELPLAETRLALEPTREARSWRSRLSRHVLPALGSDLPALMVAICGGGSTGKSSLFNALAGQELSGVGFRAGLTQRVLLVGHPDVLGAPGAADALLERLPESPVAWRSPQDMQAPGPPLFATTKRIPRNLLLLDTPDFDTGQDGELVNRALAEQVLRTAEVMVYLFTNTVYNNLSNTRFMADVVRGLGGRPTILVYRISRAASDAEVLEHCRTVAENLFAQAPRSGGWPDSVLGVYRVHESDRVALGKATPKLIPIGPTRQPIQDLLAGLDAAAIKRQVMADDLAVIQAGALHDLERVEASRRELELYQVGLEHVLVEQAMAALHSFPANEAVALTTELFIETSPPAVRFMRRTGQVISAPLRGAIKIARRFAGERIEPAEEDPVPAIQADMLASANVLRNRLLDDHLIVQVSRGDALLALAKRAHRDGELEGLEIERISARQSNVHIPAPPLVRALEQNLLDQDWHATADELCHLAPDLVGLPAGIRAELKEQIRGFRDNMGWGQRLRETLFASLSALPPILGVTYTLLTADPVSGAGLWINLSSVFGLNDLWALVSLPASLGLSQEERRQLEAMLQPVMQLWLERRAGRLVDALRDAICAPILEALQGAENVDTTSLRDALETLERRDPQ